MEWRQIKRCTSALEHNGCSSKPAFQGLRSDMFVTRLGNDCFHVSGKKRNRKEQRLAHVYTVQTQKPYFDFIGANLQNKNKNSVTADIKNSQSWSLLLPSSLQTFYFFFASASVEFIQENGSEIQPLRAPSTSCLVGMVHIFLGFGKLFTPENQARRRIKWMVFSFIIIIIAVLQTVNTQNSALNSPNGLHSIANASAAHLEYWGSKMRGLGRFTAPRFEQILKSKPSLCEFDSIRGYGKRLLLWSH